MEYNYDNKMLSMPEQVNKNTADIAELKKVTSTPAVMYNASVEIATDAGVVSQSDVIETVTTTDNSYIMDTVGSLFKVISIASGNIYILYVSSIKGLTGANGADGADGVGIQSITSVTPTQENGYTITPVTFTDTDGNQTTVNIPAKNGESDSVTHGQGTSNNTYLMSGSQCYWHKLGKMVFVTFSDVRFKNVAEISGEMWFSDLPIGKNSLSAQYALLCSSASGQLSKTVRISNQGQIINHFNNFTGDETSYYYGVLIYTVD